MKILRNDAGGMGKTFYGSLLNLEKRWIFPCVMPPSRLASSPKTAKLTPSYYVLATKCTIRVGSTCIA
jgi:hypothetical protein